VIEIYTDGACKGNPGPGGWGVVILENGRSGEHSGGPIPDTTNQRMEVQAAVEALSRVKPGSQVTLYSDSLYLVNTMTKGWKRRVNHDLWDKLDSLVAKLDVRFKWVKGHAGHPLQEQTDRLASTAAGLRVSGGAPRPDEQPRLSHLDEEGQARMVDISAKSDTERVAIVRGRVVMKPATLELIRSGKAAKGDVLSVARIAGVMGAKKTPDLIPLTHPLLITDVSVDFDLNDAESAVEITATVRTMGKTGVEMEAMTAVSISALTIYDMCKAVDRAIRIEGIRLVRKSGGKSGDLVLE
jgi:cyclic pyranopterin phosphate synthase